MQTVMARLEEQAAQMQRMSAQIEMSRPAAQMVCRPAVALREGGNDP
jgi:hypothetical protein